MSIFTVDFAEEDRLFNQEVSDIDQWWHSPRQRHIRRPYTATQIASLRPSLKIDYAASAQALKLWSILQNHRAEQTAEMTFGMIDPVLASQMEGQTTVYVSGALCAFSQSDRIGQDNSDYPWDTVPKAAARIFQSQLFHDQRQRQYRRSQDHSHRLTMTEARDYLLPIVADADMGFGSQTATMKLVKAMVEAGVAMFHLDDLSLSGKRFTDGGGHTVVPTGEYLRRLGAARMQLDIMGAESLIICRCDIDGAQYITSCIDPRDHAYILGATKMVEPLSAAKRTIQQVNEWKQLAGAQTFDEAVKAFATPEQYVKYSDIVKASYPFSFARRRQTALAVLGREPFFDPELARTPDGRYLYAPTLQAILERCLEAAPLGDVTWARMDLDLNRLTEFHTEFRETYPTRLFAAGYSATYDFAAKGYSPEDVTSLHQTLAKLGIVWQVQPGFALQGLNYFTKKFSKMWREEGIGGYLRDVQTPAMEADADGYEKMEWSGGFITDAYDTILPDL